MKGERVRLAIADGAARLTLSAPARRNAVDLAFCEEFATAAEECARSDARVILLDSDGDVFSVGGDIDDFLAHRASIEAHVHRMATLYHQGILALVKAPAPWIVAARGLVAGGAVGMVFAADLAAASSSTRICAAATRSGLTPDGGSTFSLVQLVGHQRAFDLLATNPTLSAVQAQAMGLVARVWSDEAFAAECDRLVDELAAMPSGVLASLKQLMRSVPSAALEAQLEREARAIAASAARPETLAKLDKFLARRKS